MRSLRIAISFLLITVSCIAVWERFTTFDLDKIQEKGTLRVITTYSANSYFIYKGQPLGYEYELLQMLAEHLNVKLQIVTTDDTRNIMYMLNSGTGDLVAANIAVTKQHADQVQFTDHLLTTRQVLVQRRADYIVKRPDGTPLLSVMANSPIDLIGKTVYVQEDSVFYRRLRNLEEEIGGDINIVTVSGNVSTEDLISQVYRGEIDYTIADEPTALINRAYYVGLDVSVPIGFPQRIAWVVSKNSPKLLGAVNSWISSIKKDQRLTLIYFKYYQNPRFFAERVESEFSSMAGGKISVFDKDIQKAAETIDWDWRLLAALIYQESRFNPRAQSWAGACGLMQLMPMTGRTYGVVNAFEPIQNLRGGTQHLKWLEEQYKDISDKNERMKFVLGAYNAGSGHIDDARTLAREFDKNPNVWDDNVATYVLYLSDPAYFNRRGVKYGYIRGEEPFNYVREILERYEEYKAFIEEGGANPNDPKKTKELVKPK